MLDVVTLKSMCKEYKDASDRVDHSLHSLKLELESMRRQDVYLLQKLMAVGEKIGRLHRRTNPVNLHHICEDRRPINTDFRPHVDLRFIRTRKFGSKSECRDKLRSKRGGEERLSSYGEIGNHNNDENTRKDGIDQNNDHSHDGGVGRNFKVATAWTHLNNVTQTVGETSKDQTNGQVFKDQTIGQAFKDQTIDQAFKDQTIGQAFKDQTIGQAFKDQTLGQAFKDQTIGLAFKDQTIGQAFKDQTIGQTSKGETIVQTSLRVSEDEGYSICSDSISETQLLPWKTCRNELRCPGDSLVEFNLVPPGFENEVFVNADERHTGIAANNVTTRYGKDISACYKDTVFTKKLGSGGDMTRCTCREKITPKPVLRVTHSDPSVTRDHHGSVDSVNTVESLADSVYGSLSDIDDDQTTPTTPSKSSPATTTATPSLVLSTLLSSSFHSRPAKLNEKVALTPDSDDGQIVVSSNGSPAKFEEILKRNARVWRWSCSSPLPYRINRLMTHGRVVEW